MPCLQQALLTSYSENIGLTILTGVVNRNVARIGGVILVLCGLFPPIAQFVDTIPKSVIGGVLILVLGQILVSGMEMIAEAGFTNLPSEWWHFDYGDKFWAYFTGNTAIYEGIDMDIPVRSR